MKSGEGYVMESVLRDKSYSYALKVIRVYKQIVVEYKEFVLSRQFLKAGTATGALVSEAEFAQSKPDFISKMSIALKEANECRYWISLLRDSEYITLATATDLLSDNEEIIRILVASIITAKKSEKGIV